MRLLAAVAVSCVCACGRVEAPFGPAARADAIHGGQVDADGGFPQVFIVRMRFDNATQFACSATLVTPRTLVLAAHCFDAAGAGATAMVGAWATNLSPAPPSADPRWIPLAATRQNPLWTSSNPAVNDIALGLLDADAGVALPTAMSPYLNRPLTAADVGAPLEVVGYGITAVGATDQGTRRHVSLPLAALTATNIDLGDLSSKGICNGDSGGPSFLRGADGVLRVAGIHSYDSSLACNYGQDSRVDLFGPFIRQWLTDMEGVGTCVEDGVCRLGCTPADPDCVCVADGVCNGACVNLLSDPDCPVDCVANGVCATQDCPRLDPDCSGELAPCTQVTQCQHRTCATDPQRGISYCSQPCDASTPCPAALGATSCVGGVCLMQQLPTATEGQVCTVGGTFCLAGTNCTAPVGGSLQCLHACASDTDCPQPFRCVPAQGGGQVCQPGAPEGADCTPGATVCARGTRCVAFDPDPAFCQRLCVAEADCAAGDTCTLASTGDKVCRVTILTTAALGVEQYAAAKGCAAAPGGLFLALAWLAAFALGRRPAPR